MQTYTHFIIGAMLSRQAKRQQAAGPAPAALPASAEMAGGAAGNQPAATASTLPAVRTSALLLGSIAPDLPLILLTIYFVIIDLLAGRTLAPGDDPSQSSVGILFDDLFFNDPGVIVAHNLFHAPILTVSCMLLGYLSWRSGRRWGAALFWFGLGCTLHTLIDIPTHYNDGPLIFFPFDWETRFYSPISYWDPARGGIWFALVEHVLVLIMLLVLIRDWLQRRRIRQA
jgi:membrane-bound metal-dependent hydrolase YbcI (DUF457 family)